MDGIRRKKCPLCGGDIFVSELYQYSHDYTITKSGKVSRKYKKQDCGSVEVSVAGCECGANWDADQFKITAEGYFIDYKYIGEEA